MHRLHGPELKVLVILPVTIVPINPTMCIAKKVRRGKNTALVQSMPEVPVRADCGFCSSKDTGWCASLGMA